MRIVSNQRDRNANIQILRAIAALMVVSEHAFADVARATGKQLIAIWPSGFGVTIFFVISGFIIHHSSHKWFGSNDSWKEFAWRRIWRVVPLYYLTTMLYATMTLYLPGHVHMGGITLDHLAGSLLFIPVNGLSPVYSLGWSLNFEMLFYATFAVVLFLPERQGIIALLAWFGVLMVVHPLTFPGTIAYFWTQFHIAGFLAGVLISLAAIRWPRRRYGAVWFLASASVLLAGAAIVFGDIEHYQVSVVPVVLAAGLVGAAAFTNSADVGGIGKMVGDASYSLYLLHMFVIRALAIVLPPLPPFALLGLIIGLSCIVAITSYHLFERPVLRLGHQLGRRLTVISQRQNGF